MSTNDQDFHVDIELEKGTVVRLIVPGTYTLEPGGTIDIDYSYELLNPGAMDPDDVALEVQDRVYAAWAPVLARDPEVAAHVEEHARAIEAQAAAPAPSRRPGP